MKLALRDFEHTTDEQFSAVVSSVSTSTDKNLEIEINSIKITLLPRIFAAISLRIRHLTLKGDASKLDSIMCNIPTSVTHLSLHYMPLGSLTNKKIAKIFAAIPESVVYLDLEGNGLWNQLNKKLIFIFAQLPKNIIKIRLELNCLVPRSEQEIIDLAASLKYIQELKCDPNTYFPYRPITTNFNLLNTIIKQRAAQSAYANLLSLEDKAGHHEIFPKELAAEIVSFLFNSEETRFAEITANTFFERTSLIENKNEGRPLCFVIS